VESYLDDLGDDDGGEAGLEDDKDGRANN